MPVVLGQQLRKALDRGEPHLRPTLRRCVLATGNRPGVPLGAAAGVLRRSQARPGAPFVARARASPRDVEYRGLANGMLCPPFEPPASRAAAGAAGGRGRRRPNWPTGRSRLRPLACRCRRCSGRPWRARGCGPPRRSRGSVSFNPAERAFACHSARSASLAPSQPRICHRYKDHGLPQS